MCFKIDLCDPKPHIAEEDMPVWKVVVCLDDEDNEFTGPYYSLLTYKEGCPSPPIKMKPEYDEINEGYHCLTDEDSAFLFKIKIIEEDVKYPMNKLRTFAIKRFVIPKGATYYRNMFYRECVASQIIMRKE